MTFLPLLRRVGGVTILAFALVACPGPKDGSCGILGPTRTLTADSTSLTLDVGKTKTIGIRFSSSCSSDPTTITVLSASPAIATVASTSSSATVTAAAPGTTTLNLSAAGNTTATVAVTVRALLPTTLTVAPANDTLSPLGTRTLTATVRDQNAALLPGAAVVWRSLTPTLATVSPTGLVTATAAGSATIQAKVATGTANDSLSASTTILIVPACSLIRPMPFGGTYNGRFDASSCLNTNGFPVSDRFSLTSATQAYYSIRLVPTAVTSLVPLNIGSAFYGIPEVDTAVVGLGVMRAGTFGFIVAKPSTAPSTYTVTTALNPDPRLNCLTTDVTRGVSFVTALLPTCQQRDIRILPQLNTGGRIIVTASAASFPARIDLIWFNCGSGTCQTTTVLATAVATVNGGTATIDYVGVADRFVIIRTFGPASANDNVSITISP